METENKHEVQIEETPKPNNYTAVVVVALLLLSIGIGGYFVLKNRKQNQQATTDTSNQQPALSPQEELRRALTAAQQAPNLPNMLALGLAYFNNGMYAESIAINTQALQLDSTNTVLYNNICAAYNNLSRYDEAAFFCGLALKYDKENTLAQNNLLYSEKQIALIENLKQNISNSSTKDDFVILGLYYYTRKEFKQAIDVYEKGISKVDDKALLLNNLCASYCEIKEWDKAIEYGQQALKANPDFTLAKNNLQWAIDGKAGKYN